MAKPVDNLAKCRAAFQRLDWVERDAITIIGTNGKIQLSLSRVYIRSWGWRLEFGFPSDQVYASPAWGVSARFAYSSADKALASARAAVQPMLDALSSTGAA